MIASVEKVKPPLTAATTSFPKLVFPTGLLALLDDGVLLQLTPGVKGVEKSEFKKNNDLDNYIIMATSDNPVERITGLPVSLSF